jgi:hypothetical protein
MAKKKIIRKPSKKGLKQKQKQKQKQSQTVVVNIDTNKPRAIGTTSQPAYRQQPQYITLQSEPSPPVIYNTPAAKQPVFEPVFEPVRTPVKTTNEKIGIQSTFPETEVVKTNRRSKIPVPIKKSTDEVVMNLADLYKTPNDNFAYDNTTPIARRTRAVRALSAEEAERRRVEKNDKARLKRLENKLLKG